MSDIRRLGLCQSRARGSCPSSVLGRLGELDWQEPSPRRIQLCRSLSLGRLTVRYRRLVFPIAGMSDLHHTAITVQPSQPLAGFAATLSGCSSGLAGMKFFRRCVGIRGQCVRDATFCLFRSKDTVSGHPISASAENTDWRRLLVGKAGNEAGSVRRHSPPPRLHRPHDRRRAVASTDRARASGTRCLLLQDSVRR